MAAVRRDITTDANDASRFVQAVQALKQERAGIRTGDLGIGAGPLAAGQDLSTWDLFVIWHVWAMQQLSSDGRRNAAHMGPVFLPWHRWYLLVLERQMQRVLGVGPDDFGLPYWNWAADGSALSPAGQRSDAAVWEIVGGNGGPGRMVITGPFTTAAGFTITVEQGPSGQLRATNRGLRRSFGTDANALPTTAQVDAVLTEDTYDRPGWDSSSLAFRNLLEGWVPTAGAPAMHNRVHVWVGGDMAPGSSPNDPVFFLNHCFVDRVWHRWQQTPGRTYQPSGTSPAGDPLFRHRAMDPLYSIMTRAQPQVIAMADPSQFYVYD